MWHDKMLACSRPVWNFSHSCITLNAQNSGSLKFSCCFESTNDRKLKRGGVVWPSIVCGTSSCGDWRNDNLGLGISLGSKSRSMRPSVWQWQGVVVSVRAQGSRSVLAVARSASSSLAITMTAVVTKGVDRAGLVNGEAGMHMYNFAEREQESNLAAENEKLRRHRISVANKGKVPWNKGGKHSAETIKRIKEKTSQAMQSPTVTTSEPPSVMAKLRKNARHSQTNETKAKIREKLRSKWDTKKRIRGYQEIMLKEWQNCVAEAARMGALGEIEMEWNSYSIFKKKLRSDPAPRSKPEEKKKAKAKATPTTRALKTEEHRLKISAAIRAKWEDPEYKAKVKQGMVKNSDAVKAMRKSQKRIATGDNVIAEAGCIKGPLDHGFVTAVMLGEKKRQKEEGTAKEPKDESSLVAEAKTKLRARNRKVDLLKRCAEPEQLEEEVILEDDVPEELSVSAEHSFVDPQAGEKLFRLKLLQASRSVMVQRRREAIDRAKVLMADAKKAAKKLEAAAGNDEFAHASLAEIYRLMAEAEQFIQVADALNKDIDGTEPHGALWRNTLGLYHSSRFQEQMAFQVDHGSKKRTGDNTMLSANYEEIHGRDLSKQSGLDIALGLKTSNNMMFGSNIMEDSFFKVHNPFGDESRGRRAFSSTVRLLNENASRKIRSHEDHRDYGSL